jgi:hypothetical protein
MITKTKTGRSTPYKIPQKKQMLYPTKSYQKPIFVDRLKSYYNQAKQRFSQFWYGEKQQQISFNQINALVEDIHKNKSTAIESFDMFIKNNNQKTVDQLLNQLILSKKNINFLNGKIFGLLFGLTLGNRVNRKIADKIINWAEENITHLFTQNIPMTDDFFLFSLLEIDYTRNKKLIPVVYDNLTYIREQPTGREFLRLLKSEHKEIYNALLQRKQTVKGVIQEGIEKSLNELRSKE